MNQTIPGDSRAVEQMAIRENKLGLVERLADDLAHEIKNPLHSMVINLEVLRRRILRLEGVAGSEDLLRYAEVIGTELDRVNRRVDLLLRMVRPQRETEELTTLPEVIEELRELVELESERHGVILRLEIPESISRADLPRSQGRQLVLSLLLHTLDLAPSGSTIEIRAEITPSTSKAYLAIRMPDGEDRIIDPDDDPLSYLAVSRAIAERLGGSIETDVGADAGGGSPPTSFGILLTLTR